MKKRPEQLPNLLETIKNYVENGEYYQTLHAFDRLVERDIDLLDALHVLKNGSHERRKTSFDETFQKWKYAIRGKTLDGDELRVIVTIEKNGVLIITAIDLTRG